MDPIESGLQPAWFEAPLCGLAGELDVLIHWTKQPWLHEVARYWRLGPIRKLLNSESVPLAFVSDRQGLNATGGQQGYRRR